MVMNDSVNTKVIERETEMAETEERAKQDIGQDEAMAINLKESVGTEKDYKDRCRNYADSVMSQIIKLGENTTATLASINSSIALAAQKQVENVTGVNTTDLVEGQILKSPFAEAIKAVVTAAVAEAMSKKS